MLKVLDTIFTEEIVHFELSDSICLIKLKSYRHFANCPVCHQKSHSIHDRYERRLTDLPILQLPTHLVVIVHKFRCLNKNCSRKVFSENFDCFPRYQRRSSRAQNLLRKLSIELTAEQGKRMTSLLNLSVSASTLLRIAHKEKIPFFETPRVLGIDDWAFRKGKTYGTLLINMETSKPIDLLPTRTANELEKWLSEHPGVEIVTRDRSGAYSSAINSACPKVLQVADRFHLLMNLSDALKDFFKSKYPHLSKLVKSKLQVESPDNKCVSSEERMAEKEHDPVYTNDWEQRRQNKFRIVKQLQEKGIPIRQIAREVGVSRETVRRYFLLDVLQTKGEFCYSKVRKYQPMVVELLNEKETYSGKEIIAEMKKKGYNGGETQAYELLKRLKKEQGITPAKGERKPEKYIQPARAVDWARYIDIPLNEIPDKEMQIQIKALLENDKETKIISRLASLFKRMLKNGKGNIKNWIEFIRGSKYKFAGLKRFANGLLTDLNAVINGIHMKWSNGKVEGHVNRLKTIKRKMYGRASFELLKRKVVLSNSG